MSVIAGVKARCSLAVAVVLLGLPQPAPARSRSAAAKAPGAKAAKAGKAAKGPNESADRRIRDGEAALQAGDLLGAEHLLGEAYRAHGTAVALFDLGRVALAQGRAVAAQDFQRRFLAATEGQAVPPEQRAEAERTLAQPLPHGELAILGEPGGRVLLDGRPVALLPLPLPLLVAPGSHEVRLEFPSSHPPVPLVAALSVLAERQVEVRFERATGAVIVSELPTVLLLLGRRGGPDTLPPRLQQAVVERLRTQRLTALPAPLISAAGCSTGLRCQLPTLVAHAVDHAVVIEVEALGPGPDFRTTVSLLDAQVGEVAHQVEQRCDGCTLDALAAQVATLSSDAAAQGLSRRHGNLEVLSEPPGALLELSGRVVGPTPYHGVRFAGSYAVMLRHPGYRDLTQSVVVEEGKPAQLRLRLEPQVAVVLGPAPVPRVVKLQLVELAPRPRWRLLLGGGLLAGGALTAGFGAAALSIDGQCVQPAIAPAQQCEQRYQTMPLGIGLLSAGAAVSLLGVVLMAVPGPRRHFDTTVTLPPCPPGGSLLAPGATATTPLCKN